jgi:hypothetical protein
MLSSNYSFPKSILLCAILILAPALASSCPAFAGQPNCNQFEASWSPRERSNWTTLCETGRIQLHAAQTDAGQGNEDDVIPSSFLTTLLTKSPYRDRFKLASLSIAGARVTGLLELRDLTIENSLLIADSRFEEAADLSGSRFSGSLSFVRSSFAKGIKAVNSRVDGSVFLGGSDQPTTNGDISFPRANIASVDLSGSTVAGDLNVLDADVGDTLRLLHIQTTGSVNLFRIAAQRVVLASSEVRGQLNIVASQIGGPNAVSPVLNLYSVRVQQDLHLNRTRIEGKTSLENSELSASLTLLGTILKDVDASGATIKNALDIGFNDRPGLQSGQTTWSPGARLNLTKSSVGSIATPLDLDLHYWPTSIDLDGAKIGFFDFNSNRNPSSGAERAHSQDADKQASWLKVWLARTPFAPQTYSRIRATMIANGNEDVGNQIGFASRDLELAEAFQKIKSLEPSTLLSSIGTAFVLSGSRLLTGYGYRMYLPGLWAAIFIILGAAVFALTDEARQQRMPYGLAYSFDMLLPIIRLRELHYEIDLKSPWARYYFYFHRIFGWILGSFIAAGLVGLTK